MSKREQFLLRVEKLGERGVLAPADAHTQQRFRELEYRLGERVLATLRKPRNPRFNRLVHAFGKLCAENLEVFEGMGAHQVIKRLQVEADVECDHFPVSIDGADVAEYRVPRSLSFASLDEAEFREFYKRLCQHVSARYWTSLSAHQIAELAELMPEAA